MNNEPHFTEEELEIARRVAAAYGRKGGLTKSAARARASAENGRMRGGRPPTTPDGIARHTLRVALEQVLGKPLPKEGPVAKLVHKMSSANVIRNVWPDIERLLPPNSVNDINEKVVALIDVLERDGGPTSRRLAAPVSPAAPVWGRGWGKQPSGPSVSIIDGQEVEWDEPVR